MAAHAEQQCAIYTCARSRNVASCRECTEPVCPFTRSTEMACPVRAAFEKSRCYTRKLAEAYSNRQPARQETTLVHRKLDKAIARLPWYLFAVNDFISHGVTRISSLDLARKVGVKPWLVRRDLSQFGDFGRPSLGYETAQLRDSLAGILHLDVPRSIVWVGSARIDADKSLISRFHEHNYHIVGIFDADLSRSPEMIGGLRVTPIDEMSRRIKELGAEGAVIATPAEQAQSVANTLVAAGIRGILNLTSTLIITPADVCVRNVDVVAELFALSYYCGEIHSGDADGDEPSKFEG
jgi:redox-sensing transcriptional repressor